MATTTKPHQIGVLTIIWLAAISMPAAATTITVGQGGGVDFTTIQAAIDASTTGDTVIVHPGLYVENVYFGGKSIVLRSTDPTDTATVAATIIDGNSSGSVVTFKGTETSDCVLSGFTIRNGKAGYPFPDNRGGGIYGGAYDKSRALIENNCITSNSASGGGGGLVDFDGTVRNNTITGNIAVFGAGGGLYRCNGTIENNTITSNSALQFEGGGLYGCDGIIRNNVIAHNRAHLNGGGLMDCYGTIENNTIVYNSAGDRGSGLFYCYGTVRNCILWQNSSATGAQMDKSSTPSYSCIEGWNGGLDNISDDPLFVSAPEDDYRLQAGSPCIDSGANGYWPSWPQRDHDGNCRLAGARIDMGCYEYGSSPDADGDLLADGDEAAQGTQPHLADTDGDSLVDGLEILRGSDPLAITGPGSILVPQDVTDIQVALAASLDGDTIVVSPGLYSVALQFYGTDVVLRSEAPDDPTTLAATILDGGGGGPVVSFQGTESEACVLAGFTIRNGKALRGGGIFGEETHAAIRENTIENNFAQVEGGGLYKCFGSIENNTITGNITVGDGGGLHWSTGRVEGNIISGNLARGGGGLAAGFGAILGNTISDNSAKNSGGGLYGCSGPIRGNTITGNFAEYSGGGLLNCGGTIENNLIARNWVYHVGGGMSQSQGLVQYNTIVGNSAGDKGAGMYACYGPVRHCILWANQAPTGRQRDLGSTPSFSCIQNWTSGGIGNIADDPLFVSQPTGDYHLLAGSPCIDAGADGYWSSWPQQDLDGNCRLAGAHVDMGCYEYGSTPDRDGDLLSDADEQARNTDIGNADTDGDGLRDGLEILRGSDPLALTGPRMIRFPQDIGSIQAAIGVSVDGDEIVVSPGTYVGNYQFTGTDITLRSVAPDNPLTVAATILDGGGDDRIVRFHGSETEACVLAGFTIRNGDAYDGGAIDGGGTNATIRDSVITGNSATFFGGALVRCDGPIVNNRIIHNSGAVYGGGLAQCNGRIEDTLVVGNNATDGGGLYWCNGPIRNCTVSGNSARHNGGGLSGCNGSIESSLVVANTASDGGGLHDCNGPIENTMISSNTATSNGGGMYSCDGINRNNLIVGNSAEWNGGGVFQGIGEFQNNTLLGNSAGQQGGGLYQYLGPIRNSIIWANSASEGPQIHNEYIEIRLSHSCLQDWTGGGEGNISDDPLFATGPMGEFYLSQVAAGQAGQSPCVDAGSMSAIDAGLADRTTRTDGAADDGVVDMGYHYPAAQADLPNLAVAGFDFTPYEADPAGGTAIFFAGAVHNTGSQPTAGPFWVEFRVRPVGAPESQWSYFCNSMSVVDPLAPGGSVSLLGEPHATYALPEGVYRVGVVIDPRGTIGEQREDDNVVWLQYRQLYVGGTRTSARDWKRYR